MKVMRRVECELKLVTNPGWLILAGLFNTHSLFLNSHYYPSILKASFSVRKTFTCPKQEKKKKIHK